MADGHNGQNGPVGQDGQNGSVGQDGPVGQNGHIWPDLVTSGHQIFGISSSSSSSPRGHVDLTASPTVKMAVVVERQYDKVIQTLNP